MRPIAVLIVLVGLTAIPQTDHRSPLLLPAFSAPVLAATGAAQAPEQEWVDVELTPNTFREYPDGYRQHTIDLTLFPARGIEYKVAMKAGDTIVYTWHVEGMEEAELLTSEFHGHTEPVPGEPGTVMFYRKAKGDRESGSLIAPFDGIHGWYMLNESLEPIVVQLTVSGFFELAEQ